MPVPEAQTLFTTINELEDLRNDKLIALLEQMQQVLGTPYSVMSVEDLQKIITFLAAFRNNAEQIFDLQTRLQEFDCYDIDKNIHNIPRSLAIVRGLSDNKLQLHILTDKKYHAVNKNETKKYDPKKSKVVLGSGAYKSGKVCLAIEFISGSFVVQAVAKQTARLYQFVDPIDKRKLQVLSDALSKATSLEHTLHILNPWNGVYYGLYYDLLCLYEEVRISKDLRDVSGINLLALGQPFIKKLSDNKTYLLTHLFSQKADSDLYKINLVDADVSLVIEQMLYITSIMHERNVLHRDIKNDNILIDMQNGKPQLRFIDFGRAVDLNKLKQDTLSLLGKLGFIIETTDGLVEGRLLDNISVSYALALLEKSKIINQAVLHDNSMITLKCINSRLAQHGVSHELKFMELYATLGFDAPEVFAAIGSCFKNFPNRPSVGRDIYNKLSRKALKFICNQIDPKQDVWSLAISMMLLYLRRVPSLSNPTDIAIIESNELFSRMLHPDPKWRCSAAEALQIYSNNPRLVIPEASLHAGLVQNYMNKIQVYNQSLEDSEFNFDVIKAELEQYIKILHNNYSSCVELDSAIFDIQQLIKNRLSKLDSDQKSTLLVPVLTQVMSRGAFFIKEVGARVIDSLILLILNAGIAINHADLVYITHIIINNGLYCNWVDAIAPFIHACKHPIDLALPFNGNSIWDIPLNSLKNIGSRKVGALARYIEKVVAVHNSDFIYDILTNRQELFAQRAAMFILDQRLRDALERITGNSMLSYLSRAPILVGFCMKDYFFINALQYKRLYETQYVNNNFVTDADLSKQIINAINKNNVHDNVIFMSLISLCFVPYLFKIQEFAICFKKALINLSTNAVDCTSLIKFFTIAIPQLDQSRYVERSELKQYYEDLLTILQPRQCVRSKCRV